VRRSVLLERRREGESRQSEKLTELNKKGKFYRERREKKLIRTVLGKRERGKKAGKKEDYQPKTNSNKKEDLKMLKSFVKRSDEGGEGGGEQLRQKIYAAG